MSVFNEVTICVLLTFHKSEKLLLVVFESYTEYCSTKLCKSLAYHYDQSLTSRCILVGKKHVWKMHAGQIYGWNSKVKSGLRNVVQTSLPQMMNSIVYSTTWLRSTFEFQKATPCLANSCELWGCNNFIQMMVPYWSTFYTQLSGTHCNVDTTNTSRLRAIRKRNNLVALYFA